MAPNNRDRRWREYSRELPIWSQEPSFSFITLEGVGNHELGRTQVPRRKFLGMNNWSLLPLSSINFSLTWVSHLSLGSSSPCHMTATSAEISVPPNEQNQSQNITKQALYFCPKKCMENNFLSFKATKFRIVPAMRDVYVFSCLYICPMPSSHRPVTSCSITLPTLLNNHLQPIHLQNYL